MSAAALGVALTGHRLPLDAVLRLVRRADALGYSLVLLDGDSAIAEARPERPVYDPTALQAAALLASERIRIAAIHLPVFWNALLLARSLTTLQELSAGRLVGFFGVGAQRGSHRLGLPEPDGGERVDRLDELLETVRPLLAGASVTKRGRFSTLEQASVTLARAPIPITVSGAGGRALDVVRRHADAWDANVPPLRERIEPLRARIGRALPTWCWVFARPGATFEDAARTYRHQSPWFRGLGPHEVERAILYGEPARCRDRLAQMRAELGLALPILDLAGLDEPTAAHALEALAAATPSPIS